MINRLSQSQSRQSRPTPSPGRLLQTKRQLNEIDQSPAKKARLTNTQRFLDPVQPIVHPKYSFILEWLECVGSNRDRRRRRSEPHPKPADDSPPIPPRRARSAPAMNNTCDPNDCAFSTMPSTWTPSIPDLNTRSGISGPLVESPLYRVQNLRANGIYFNHPCDRPPEHITNFVNQMRRDRDSPGPSADDISQDRDLHDLSQDASEAEVATYFLTRVFVNPRSSDYLKRNEKQQVKRDHVPDAGTGHKVSTPVPDALYGYRDETAFRQQQAQLLPMYKEAMANKQGLMYPFFVIEFKGENGSLWAATNQCLGGAATCINVVEKLNDRFKQRMSNSPINSAVFSIAMNGTEARLYVSWKQNERDYFMAHVDSFLLQDPEHHAKFYNFVHNILDWGRGERLEQIRGCLDNL
ncbi:hypothetical protein Neosp_003512 [[Neocosmospora] mangrovei]